jgi:AcrR family transcriptional regulator
VVTSADRVAPSQGDKATEKGQARPLTRSQQARLQRVVDAAMELGLEGGYEAVQMRDVASRAHVAMGTVYRYFTSKDHLLAAALVHWVEQLDARLSQAPAKGETQADRVVEVLDRALRAMGRQPRLVEAVFSSLASSDPSTIECQNQISSLMDGVISRAMGEPQPDDFADRSRMVGHVWFSSIVGWVNGRTDLPWVHGEIEVAVRLLLGEEASKK